MQRQTYSREAIAARMRELQKEMHSSPRPPPPTKKPKRFPQFNEFIDNWAETLTDTEALAWLTIWRHERDGRAEVSRSCIAKTTNCSLRQVSRIIQTLRQRGFLTVVRKGHGHTPATYQTELPNPRLREDTHVQS